MDAVIAALAGNIAAAEQTAAAPAINTAWRRELAAALLAAGCIATAAGLAVFWLISMPVVDMRL